VRGEDGQWLSYDDESVTKMNPVDVVSKDAYLLYYVKR